jgi:hypothetical protein
MSDSGKRARWTNSSLASMSHAKSGDGVGWDHGKEGNCQNVGVPLPIASSVVGRCGGLRTEGYKTSMWSQRQHVQFKREARDTKDHPHIQANMSRKGAREKTSIRNCDRGAAEQS